MDEIVILGPSGNVGSAIQFHFNKMNQKYSTINRNMYDLNNYSSIKNMLTGMEKKTIVNCVAYMSADNCEINSNISEKVNFIFPSMLSEIINEYTPHQFIQLSTDFVFDGKSRNSPYLPTDPPNPINIYGRHKASAEESVLNILGDRARIVRLSSFVGKSQKKSTFLERIVVNHDMGERIGIVDDLKISISNAGLLSSDLLSAFDDNSLVQHSANPGATTWFELAEYFLHKSGREVNLDRISINNLGLPAFRPRYSVLSPSRRFRSNGQLGWTDAVDDEYFGDNRIFA